MMIDLESARRRRSTSGRDAIDAAFMLAVYQAARERRMRRLGRLPVPPLTDEGLRLLERSEPLEEGEPPKPLEESESSLTSDLEFVVPEIPDGAERIPDE